MTLVAQMFILELYKCPPLKFRAHSPFYLLPCFCPSRNLRCGVSYAASEMDGCAYSHEALYTAAHSAADDDSVSNLMSMECGSESPSPYGRWAPTPPVSSVVKILMVDDSKSTLKFNVRVYFSCVPGCYA